MRFSSRALKEGALKVAVILYSWCCPGSVYGIESSELDEDITYTAYFLI